MTERATDRGPRRAESVLGRRVSAILLNIYSMRMGAVFMLASLNIARRTRFMSRWLIVAGLVIAPVLLVTAGTVAWVELLFPAWILALSLDVLVRGPGVPAASPVSAD